MEFLGVNLIWSTHLSIDWIIYWLIDRLTYGLINNWLIFNWYLIFIWLIIWCLMNITVLIDWLIDCYIYLYSLSVMVSCVLDLSRPLDLNLKLMSRIGFIVSETHRTQIYSDYTPRLDLRCLNINFSRIIKIWCNSWNY